jgi:hypothetical protein
MTTVFGVNDDPDVLLPVMPAAAARYNVNDVTVMIVT